MDRPAPQDTPQIRISTPEEPPPFRDTVSSLARGLSLLDLFSVQDS